MSTPSLFAEPPSRLSTSLATLASQNIFIGTSSWKYPGWMGQIYHEENYRTRGKFSQKRFEETCLAEYADTFPIVCGDFSFYQFPSEAFWRKLFASAPSSLRFAFKAPEEITVKQFPTHARYGPRAGLVNESFLNADIFERMFLELLEPYAHRTTVVMLEFGTIPKSAFAKSERESAEKFVELLDEFLGKLPTTFRYGVEIRNADFLGPLYFDCLHRHGVAHVFNAWTRMPELQTQIELPASQTAEFLVTRALLKRDQPYEEAVAKFAPYEKVQEPNPAARIALAELVKRALKQRQPAYLFVNNRLEGNAPGTIEAVLDILEDD